MKRLVLFLCVLVSPFVMAADTDAVAPAMVGGNGEPQACTSAGVVKSADGMGGIHVRTGPSDEDLVFGFLPDGKKVWICDHQEQWVGVVYPDKDESCETDSPINPEHPYRGKCLAGWVQASDIKQVAE